MDSEKESHVSPICYNMGQNNRLCRQRYPSICSVPIQKAFDTVPHNRLMKKVQAHGIEGPILRWITEWLKNRKQRVVLDGVESE